MTTVGDQPTVEWESTVFDSLKTAPALLNAIEVVANRTPEPGDVDRQRVSFIFSAVKDTENLTDARIKEVLSNQ